MWIQRKEEEARERAWGLKI